MTSSTRTPEDEPNCCMICQKTVHPDPSQSSGAPTCPDCGHLLWFQSSPDAEAEIVLHEVESLLGLLDSWEEMPSPPSQIILDLSNLPWLSSIALGRLLRWKQTHRRTQKVGLRLNPELLEVFKITRLDEFFEIAENGEKGVRDH